jgi:glycolate oxidase FAD binding subunit
MADLTDAIGAQIKNAFSHQQPLRLRGHGSRGIATHLPGAWLELADHSGIITYHPEELVVTVRCGTPLAELEAELASHGQTLPFLAPMPKGRGTIGGAVALGLAGAERPYLGSVRDALLGMRICDGQGEVLHFGGEVIKNVAGFDVTRFMCGALGSFGVLLELSLRLMPLPQAQCTLGFAMDIPQALAACSAWVRQGVPIVAMVHGGEHLIIRLAGGSGAVAASRRQLGGTELDGALWHELRHETGGPFATGLPPWRIHTRTPPSSLPPNSWLLWEGDLLYVERQTEDASQDVAALAGSEGQVLIHGALPPPAPPRYQTLYRRLKQVWDPHHILNQGLWLDEAPHQSASLPQAQHG